MPFVLWLCIKPGTHLSPAGANAQAPLTSVGVRWAAHLSWLDLCTVITERSCCPPYPQLHLPVLNTDSLSPSLSLTHPLPCSCTCEGPPDCSLSLFSPRKFITVQSNVAISATTPRDILHRHNAVCTHWHFVSLSLLAQQNLIIFIYLLLFIFSTPATQ